MSDVAAPAPALLAAGVLPQSDPDSVVQLPPLAAPVPKGVGPAIDSLLFYGILGFGVSFPLLGALFAVLTR